MVDHLFVLRWGRCEFVKKGLAKCRNLNHNLSKFPNPFGFRYKTV